MAEKRCLVVYYSRTGVTRKVAEAIAEMLQCDIEEVVDTKKRGGPIGFVIAGKDAALKKLTVIQPTEKAPASYELVVVGTPVWAGTVSCAMRTYLSQNKDALGKVAFFLTTGGTGVEKTFEHMGELCGKSPLACLSLRTKEVRKGNYLDRVKEFVQKIGS